jgi:putative methyltransferase (TIGR04325 family)
VFQSREEALQRARALGHAPVGYDTPGVADRGRQLYEQMHPFDYPALLWLLRGIEEGGRHVVDLGGHLGVKYRVYRRLWDLPPDLCWTVCDTPDVVRAARDLPPEDQVRGLTFTSDRACLADAEILFASGVLQYLEEPLYSILAGLPRRPHHLVLNKVPLADGPEIWTIQNVGAALVPYHVMNRDRFLDEMTRLGYRLLDSWTVAEYGARIPFAPGYGTKHNSGLAMTRG